MGGHLVGPEVTARDKTVGPTRTWSPPRIPNGGTEGFRSNPKVRMSGLTLLPPLDITVTVQVPSPASAVVEPSLTEQLSLLTVRVRPEASVAAKAMAWPSARSGVLRAANGPASISSGSGHSRWPTTCGLWERDASQPSSVEPC